jgi:hypothetical protein
MVWMAALLVYVATGAGLTQLAMASFDVAVTVGSAHATTVVTALTSVTMDVRRYPRR